MFNWERESIFHSDGECLHVGLKLCKHWYKQVHVYWVLFLYVYFFWMAFCSLCFKLRWFIIFGIADLSILAVLAFGDLYLSEFLNFMLCFFFIIPNMCFVLSFLTHFSENLLLKISLLFVKVSSSRFFSAVFI